MHHNWNAEEPAIVRDNQQWARRNILQQALDKGTNTSGTKCPRLARRRRRRRRIYRAVPTEDLKEHDQTW